MIVEFLEIAVLELEETAFFYDLEQDGLGERFKAEVRQTIERIRGFPEAWPREQDEVRKCFVHTFPYKILYAVEDEQIVILAVAHQHRQPDYWVERFGEQDSSL